MSHVSNNLRNLIIRKNNLKKIRNHLRNEIYILNVKGLTPSTDPNMKRLFNELCAIGEELRSIKLPLDIPKYEEKILATSFKIEDLSSQKDILLKRKKDIEKILIEQSNNQKSNNNMINIETELDFIIRDIFTINRKIPKYEEKKTLLEEINNELSYLSELYNEESRLTDILSLEYQQKPPSRNIIKDVENKLKYLYGIKKNLIKDIIRNKIIIKKINERLNMYNNEYYNPETENNVVNINFKNHNVSYYEYNNKNIINARISKGPDVANIFYKTLTKKVRQLNNNSSNKWQLHLGSTIGKSYGGKNTKITDFLSIKTPIRQYVSNKPEGLWTSGLYKEYNTVNLSTNSNAHNELNSKEECSIRNTSFINWISSQSRSNDGPNTKYDPRGKTDFLIVKGDKSQILQITTLKEFEAFDRKYRTIDQFGRVGIDWIRVAQKYSGINITPYQEEYGMKRDHWYNGWDCASQVIWDPIAIKEIRKLNLDTINFNSIRSGNLNINNINLNTINFDVIHKK